MTIYLENLKTQDNLGDLDIWQNNIKVDPIDCEDMEECYLGSCKSGNGWTFLFHVVSMITMSFPKAIFHKVSYALVETIQMGPTNTFNYK
jgi:hypothetical protein